MPKIAYAQMKVVAGHPDANTKKILQFIDESRSKGADMVIFPELAVPGRMVGENFWAQPFLLECISCGKEIIAASKSITVAFGNVHVKDPKDSDSPIYNSIFFAKNRKLLCEPLCKEWLILDEEKYFYHSGCPPLPISIKLGRKNYSVGIIMGRYYSRYSAQKDFYINFLAEPFCQSSRYQKDYGFKYKVNFPIIYVGCVGIQNTGKTIYTFDGANAVFNSRGEIVQYAEPFADCLNIIEFDEIDEIPALEIPEVSETEKIYRAISYGVKTFLEQIGMSKVVIGVSGGIDSAVAAAIYTKVLGAENVVLVNMPSVFNSATTKNLSEQLAKNLGCKYYVVPIQESVDWTVKQLEERGIAVSSFVKENIQARDRSSRILAAIAASLGGGFTCNANKAESTVGYATLYGDEAGFLSALADLWKFQVYSLARYLNEKIFCREVIPQGIIDIVPSAELSTAQNVDEGKGDPLKYPYHDYLFRAFAEDNQTPEDILRWYANGELEKNIGCEVGLVEKYFPTSEDFIADLERWWKQFNGMGVAKRIQSPPILAVTNSPYGGRAESQNGVHFTEKYFELKRKLTGTC